MEGLKQMNTTLNSNASLNHIYLSLNAHINTEGWISSCSKDMLITFRDEVRANYMHIKNGHSKRRFAAIEKLIANILQPPQVFPVTDDSFREITRNLFLADLLCLRQVNRLANKIAHEILGQRIEKFGYTSKNIGKYLTDLKNEFQIAIRCGRLQSTTYIRHKRKIPFVQALNRFYASPNGQKIKMFVKDGFMSDLFKLVRDLIQPAGIVGRFQADPQAIANIVQHNEENLFNFLLDGFTYPEFVSTPLHHAAQRGNLTAVKYLIKKDPAAINRRGLHGATPLSFACGTYYRDHSDQSRLVIELLLMSKADPNIADLREFKFRPLHHAIEKKRADLVKLLLDFGADPHKTKEDVMSPLEYAKKSYAGEKMIELLSAYL